MNDFQLYFKLGLDHILSLSSIDHILFLMALIMVFSYKNWRKLLWLISLFTIAHTSSLLLSVYGFAKLDGQLIEKLILATILITALSNIIIKNDKILHKTHLYFSFLFGLVHGLGFAKDFKMMSVGQANKLLALLSFALGIETAQIALGVLILLAIAILSKVFNLSKREMILLVSGAVLGFVLALF
jgi:hypothetical protein